MLYEQHRDWVIAIARRFTGNRDDALDVMQEVFIYLYSKFPGFALTATLRGFLYPVVKHKSISVIRRRRKVVDLDAYRSGTACPTELQWFDSAADAGLTQLVSALPDAQREVVLLRFGLDFRLHEIADALSVPLGTVKSRLHNALKTLRETARPPVSQKNRQGR